MRITNEIEQSNKLIEQFLSNKDRFSYANIGLENEYLGWVGDLKIKDNTDIRTNNSAWQFLTASTDQKIKVETSYHFKNGALPKSQMSRYN